MDKTFRTVSKEMKLPAYQERLLEVEEFLCEIHLKWQNDKMVVKILKWSHSYMNPIREAAKKVLFFTGPAILA